MRSKMLHEKHDFEFILCRLNVAKSPSKNMHIYDKV